MAVGVAVADMGCMVEVVDIRKAAIVGEEDSTAAAVAAVEADRWAAHHT